MELNINTPAYFRDYFGTDDEVYKYSQAAHLFFKNKNYSDILHIIGIIPIAAPQQLYDNGAWKEGVQLVGNNSCAIISVRMDLEEYHNADSTKRILLTKDIVLKAVKRIKSKGKFDYETFEQDFNLFSVDWETQV